MRYTSDGFCFATVRPDFEVRIQEDDTPLALEVVEGGFTVVELGTLRDNYRALSPYHREVPTLGLLYLALVDNLTTWLDEPWCDHCGPRSGAGGCWS